MLNSILSMPGTREVGFVALSDFGPIDASHAYDCMRDFVFDGQANLGSLLVYMPYHTCFRDLKFFKHTTRQSTMISYSAVILLFSAP
jgi:hypothetical protein